MRAGGLVVYEEEEKEEEEEELVYEAEGSWFRNRPRLLQLSAAKLSQQHRFTGS